MTDNELVTRVLVIIILWPEVQSHSDDSHVHATGLRSARALAQAHPTTRLHLCAHFLIITVEAH